jgi:hypothetical protein
MAGTLIETTVRPGAPGDHMRRPLNCGLDDGHPQAKGTYWPDLPF